MIKAFTICYLLFPTIARKAVDFSISGFMSALNIDYYHSNVETVLLDCQDVIKISK